MIYSLAFYNLFYKFLIKDLRNLKKNSYNKCIHKLYKTLELMRIQAFLFNHLI